MEYENIITEKRGKVFILTLNRPSKRNALSSAMWAEMIDAIKGFEADPELRVMILAGNGPAFSGGADIKEQAAGTWGPPEGHRAPCTPTVPSVHAQRAVVTQRKASCVPRGVEFETPLVFLFPRRTDVEQVAHRRIPYQATVVVR
jgi:enoyl-CoA hydratase/carnithine racemase